MDFAFVLVKWEWVYGKKNAAPFWRCALNSLLRSLFRKFSAAIPKCKSASSFLLCWWMYLITTDPQNRMHVCYLYLSSTLSLKLLAESLAIEYHSDNTKSPSALSLYSCRVLFARVLSGRLRVLYAAVALQSFLPAVKKRFHPSVAKQWVFSVRLCSLEEYGISSHRSVASVHPGHYTMKLCCSYSTGTSFG